jgi:hypothetical protein
MKRPGLQLFLAAVLTTFLLGCGTPGGEVPRKLTLYSLDFRETFLEKSKRPHDDGKERIGEYVVLGKIEIKNPDQRKEIMDSIDQAIREGGQQKSCFDPRHLLRVVDDEGTTDYTICFQCSNYTATGAHSSDGMKAISDQPKGLLNSILEGAKIEIVP